MAEPTTGTHRRFGHLQLVGPAAAESPAELRWTVDPPSLLALAVALERAAGMAPCYSGVLTPELVTWRERYRRSAEILAEVANHDPRALRSIAGAPWDDDGPRPPGTGLAIMAAATMEGGQ